MIQKTVENGVLKINGVSFFEFNKELSGLNIIDKKSGVKVPRFILFWKGLSIDEIKYKYLIGNRER